MRERNLHYAEKRKFQYRQVRNVFGKRKQTTMTTTTRCDKCKKNTEMRLKRCKKLFHRLVGCLTNGRYTILKRTIRYSGCRVAPTKSADRRRAKGRKKWQKHERLRKRNGGVNERLNAANGNAKMIITRVEVSRKLQYNFVLESFHFYFSIFCSFRLNEFRHSKQSRTYIHRTKS